MVLSCCAWDPTLRTTTTGTAALPPKEMWEFTTTKVYHQKLDASQEPTSLRKGKPGLCNTALHTCKQLYMLLFTVGSEKWSVTETRLGCYELHTGKTGPGWGWGARSAGRMQKPRGITSLRLHFWKMESMKHIQLDVKIQ